MSDPHELARKLWDDICENWLNFKYMLQLEGYTCTLSEIKAALRVMPEVLDE